MKPEDRTLQSRRLLLMKIRDLDVSHCDNGSSCDNHGFEVARLDTISEPRLYKTERCGSGRSRKIHTSWKCHQK